MNLNPELAAQIDEMILAGAKETDVAKRTAIYEEIQKAATENAISIWMYQALDGVHFQKWISGYIFNPAFGNPERAFFYGLTKEPPQ